MFCTKCGKEIPDGEKKVCDECEKSIVTAIVEEEKEEIINKEDKKEKKEKVKKENAKKDSNWDVTKEKDKNCLLKKDFLYLIKL